jgi:hypothetical protein
MKSPIMKTLLLFLLVVSLTANAWLWRRGFVAGGDVAPRTEAVAVSGPNDAHHPATASATDRVETSARGLLPIEALNAFNSASNPAALRDALRAAGADDATVRAILEGILRRRFADELAKLHILRMRTMWWRVGVSPIGSENPRMVNEIITTPMRALFGPDPLELAEAEGRFAFLPPEKRRLLAVIDFDYADLLGQERTAVYNDRTKAEIEAQQLLAQERRRDILAALSPTERAEYELRFSGTAAMVSQRLATFAGTEEDFRALKPALDTFDAAAKAIPRDQNFSAAYTALQQQTMDQLVGAMGRDRALEFIWSGQGAYAATVQAVQKAGLPGATAAQVYQLAAETGQKAAAIHYDTSLSTEQKRAALTALQQSTEPALNALVPGNARTALPREATVWLTGLSSGSYLRYQPTLLSSGFMTMPATITAAPVGAAPSPIPLPRGSGG